MLLPPLASILFALALESQDVETPPPPGMVLVERKTITVGTDVAIAKTLVQETDIVSIWGETPAHEVAVDDFFLMLTEVTNEQYAEFVAATRAKPPASWGRKAIDAAQAAFLEEQGRLKGEAKQRGEALPETQIFDRIAWWDLHWQESAVEFPTGIEAHPVTNVDHAQAKAYARWAGLRLMKEEEFQRAVRGETKARYPWGEAWEPGRAVTLEGKFRSEQPVGTTLTGASAEGVLDLLGNVWEWTDSPYEPYPKHAYDVIEIAEGNRKRYIELQCDFDPDMRVVVGGSYSTDALAARATTRRSSLRSWATEVMGFRCAASPRPGLDVAREALRTGIDRSVARKLDFDFARTIALDRWKSRKGTAAERFASREGGNPLAGYAVVTDYDCFVFVPIADAKTNSLRELASRSVDVDPVILGVFSTTLALDEPELPPGDYVLAWRGSGRGRPNWRQEEESGDEGGDPAPLPDPIWEELDFDPMLQHFIVLDRHGEPLVAVPSSGLAEGELRDGTIETAHVPAGALVKEPRHELKLSASIEAAGRGFSFELVFELAPGTFDGDWRRP